MARCLHGHFAGPGAPNRLVYLLDHEYTACALDWPRLKGPDADRVAHLRAAADGAGCEATLGLVEVHETWSAVDTERRDRWIDRRRHSLDDRDDWDGWDEDDEDVYMFDADADGSYELEELIEREVTLRYWINGPGTKAEKVGLPLPDVEICATTPSGDLQPYASEYEGYMGNYGNTLDRWYHRGAVVVWPRARAFAVRAEASPSWALDTLLARLRRGDLIGAREGAATLAPFWDSAALRVEANGLFGKALRTAVRLDEPSAASVLLHPFRLEMLTASHARSLHALVEEYGESWARDLVASWSTSPGRYGPSDPALMAWTVSLPRLCCALRDSGSAGT